MALACATDAQWRTLAGDDRPAGPGRSRPRRSAWPAGASWTAPSSRGRRHGPEFALQDELQALGIPAHAVQNSPECRADPQLGALGHFVSTDHAEFGPVEVEGPRYRLSATPGTVGPAPTLGQHLLPVLREILGYDEDRITELVVAGALE